eukprot:COSAG01_NODE_62826_length_282_cov_2.814208_1_plen_32_part_10
MQQAAGQQAAGSRSLVASQTENAVWPERRLAL